MSQEAIGRLILEASTGMHGDVAKRLSDAWAVIAEQLRAPIDMVLHCPACLHQHIDAATETWPNDPHRSHLCEKCGFVWRPADVATNGVAAIKTRGKVDMPVLYGPAEALALRAIQHHAQRHNHEPTPTDEDRKHMGWDGDRP